MEDKNKKEVNKKKKTIKKSTNKEVKKEIKKISEEKKVIDKKVEDKKLDEDKAVENKKEEDIKVVKEKKKKTTFNLLEVILIMIITALFGAFVGSSVVYFNTHKNSVKIDNKDLEEFVSTYNKLLNEYYTKLDKDELLNAGIEGMIRYLNDPYSTYMDTEESDEFNQEIEGSFVGMGVEIRKEKDGSVKIVTIFEGSAAEKYGFKVDDLIIKVDGKDVTKLDISSVSKLIKGKEGTKVKITIKRDGKEQTIELTRSNVDIPSVSSKTFDKNNKKIGYIRINVFAKNTGEQFEKHLNKMKDNNISNLIIDVRGNSGGYLTVVTDIASHFLDNSKTVYRLETKGIERKIFATGNNKYNGNVVMLVDGGSASASEILASSLNENNNVELIGTKTYGKSTVQKAYTLSNGATVKYTIQSWKTAKGNDINKKGINPTKEVKLDSKYTKDPSDNSDNQLQSAIDALAK